MSEVLTKMMCPMCDSERGTITSEWLYNSITVQQVKCDDCRKKYKFYQNDTRFWTIPKKDPLRYFR